MTTKRMSDEMERVVDLGKRIAATRETLASLEQELAEAVGTVQGHGLHATSQKAGGVGGEGSVPERVLRLLSEAPGRQIRVAELVERLRVPLKEVSRTVSRLAERGRVERVGRGVYRAKKAEESN